ncbi:hypothetical protein LCGC14_3039350, partial [marine sediment metagenome]
PMPISDACDVSFVFDVAVRVSLAIADGSYPLRTISLMVQIPQLVWYKYH